MKFVHDPSRDLGERLERRRHHIVIGQVGLDDLAAREFQGLASVDDVVYAAKRRIPRKRRERVVRVYEESIVVAVEKGRQVVERRDVEVAGQHLVDGVQDHRDVVPVFGSADEFRGQLVHGHRSAPQVPQVDLVQMVGGKAQGPVDVRKAVDSTEITLNARRKKYQNNFW